MENTSNIKLFKMKRIEVLQVFGCTECLKRKSSFVVTHFILHIPSKNTRATCKAVSINQEIDVITVAPNVSFTTSMHFIVTSVLMYNYTLCLRKYS